MPIPWRAWALGADGEWLVAGDVLSRDRAAALQAARERWPNARSLRVQSHASLAVEGEEARVRAHDAAKLLTLAAAARLVRVDLGCLYRAVEAGELPVRRIADSTLLRVEQRAVKRWVSEKAQQGKRRRRQRDVDDVDLSYEALSRGTDGR